VCDDCGLAPQCVGARGKPVHGSYPRGWKPGGLMIVGEGPDEVDASRNVPFSGPDGRLLNALLEAAGTDRRNVWVTYATMGRMPRAKTKLKGAKAHLHSRYPTALYSCLPRLEAEIQLAQPRVIVTMGNAPLIALTGYEVTTTKNVHFECENPDCGPKRKLNYPCLVCANGACSWYAPLQDPDPDAQAADLKELYSGACPDCSQSIKRMRPRAMKCPECAGRKMRPQDFLTFEHDHGLIGRDGVAGAVFDTTTLSSRLDEFGVKYIVPTYAMKYCRMSSKQQNTKFIIGQFAAGAAQRHLEKARDLLRRDAKFEVEVLATDDPKVVDDYIAKAPADTRWALDIETDGREGPWAENLGITCLGIARADSPEALVIDTRAIRNGWNEGSPLMDAIHRILTNGMLRKVFHNGIFDRTVMARLWGIETEGVVGDTMYDHNACWSDEEHGLGFVAHELLDAPPWKDSRKPWGKKGDRHALSGYDSFAELAKYNATDTRATALVDERLHGTKGGGRGLLDSEKVRQVADLDLEMSNIAIDMELNGLPVDLERFAAIEKAHVTVIEQELEIMRDMVRRSGTDWKPTGAMLQWALFDPQGPLRLLPTKLTDGGASGIQKPSAAKDVLIRMADQHPFIGHLLRWRQYDYALGHYVRGKGLAPAEDGRIHPTWKVTGARTGRWSSSPNFQNWPKGDGVDEFTNLRTAIVAPKGRKLVGADYAQLEMRIVASLSNDPELIRRCIEADESRKLEPDWDPHSFVAMTSFGSAFLDLDITDKKQKIKRKALRDVAKRVFYGLGYGAGAATILASIYDSGDYEGPPLTTKIIEAVMRGLFKAFPGIPRYRNGALESAHALQMVVSPIFARRRYFPLGDIDATVAYNFPIQSAAADIMSMQLAVLAKALPLVDPSAMIIAQVHDAIYVECDEALAPAVAECITNSLSVTLALVQGAEPMPYTAGAEIADSWDKAA